MTFEDLQTGELVGKTVIVDVDGTLVLDKSPAIDGDVLQKLMALSEENFVLLASNGSPENAEKFASLVGIQSVRSHKPFVGDIPKMLPFGREVVVIGDKYLTDGLFARNLGAQFLKVTRLEAPTDSWSVQLTYLLDDAVWKIKDYAHLLRPWQWVKNLLVIAPVFFAGAFFSPEVFGKSVLAAVIFSLFASAVYVFNDLSDMESDKLHPKKKFRPLPSGTITKREAILVGAFVFFAGLLGLSLLPQIIITVLAYVLLNVAYTLVLKNIPVVDVAAVSLCYILRIFAGGLAAGVYISPWIILCVFFGSLFVILGKRYSEFSRENRRKVLELYSKEELSVAFAGSGIAAILIYAIWSVLGHPSEYLAHSTFFVVVAIFRVMNLVYRHDLRGESPEILVFKDRVILGAFILWLLYVTFIFVY